VNTTDLDMLAMGASVGVLGGGWLGYQLRKLVEHAKTSRRATIRAAAKPMPGFGTVLHEQDARKVMRPNVIPLERKRKQTPVREWDPDRDDVIEALVGAGYKKTEASVAVDACSLDERGHGDLAVWIVSALKHAKAAK
jgi:hypothetical protein